MDPSKEFHQKLFYIEKEKNENAAILNECTKKKFGWFKKVFSLVVFNEFKCFHSTIWVFCTYYALIVQIYRKLFAQKSFVGMKFPMFKYSFYLYHIVKWATHTICRQSWVCITQTTKTCNDDYKKHCNEFHVCKFSADCFRLELLLLFWIREPMCSTNFH